MDSKHTQFMYVLFNEYKLFNKLLKNVHKLTLIAQVKMGTVV